MEKWWKSLLLSFFPPLSLPEARYEGWQAFFLWENSFQYANPVIAPLARPAENNTREPLRLPRARLG